ncbi:MAG: NACHT domain-containing protein, partial [Candidatus Auribacterota bacterium]|nr:NACHT domain-containing protein [Candidatus Auribacterota bacterium]
KNKLLTIGMKKYAEFLAKEVGLFPLFATSKYTSVDNAYVKVSISKEIEKEHYKSRDQITERIKKQKQGQTAYSDKEVEILTPLEAIDKSEDNFSLIGDPGSGKTTAFRFITIFAAKGGQVRGKKRFPIFLAVRDMAIEEKGILETIKEQFELLDIKEPRRVIDRILKSGKCILLIDGLDETKSKHRKKIVSELIKIKSKYSKSIFCVSARPYSMEIGIAGFIKWETLALQLEQRKLFVEKWFDSVNPKKGKRLIKECTTNPGILDLGSNPLLLSLICALYDNDLDIPSEPDELFSRTIEGIFGRWDAFRNIARDTVLGTFSTKKRIIIVSWLAAHLFEENQIVFSVEDVNNTKCLEKLSELFQEEIPETDILLKSLYNDFGIIIERAPNLFSFSHLSLHEYLVAKYIVDNRIESDLIKSHINDGKWQSVFVLIGKLLTQADDFINLFTDKLVLMYPDDFDLISKIIESKPMCSPATLSIVFDKIICEIDKRYKIVCNRVKPSFVTEYNSLTISLNKINRSNNFKEPDSKNFDPKNPYTWSSTFLLFDPFTHTFPIHEYLFDHMKKHKSPNNNLFRLIKKMKYTKIIGITLEFYGGDESMQLFFKPNIIVGASTVR